MAQAEGTAEVGPGALAGAASPADLLALADWRRCVGALYADVRRLAVHDPRAALAHWRAVREGLYRGHPQSPVPPAGRAAFRAHHFPREAALRFELAVARDAASAAEPDSAGLAFRRVGWVDVPFAAGLRRLALFWIEGYADGLFLPFRDATSGNETYAGGRYLLDTAKGADLGGDLGRGTLTLDFNFAYHPSCAFDARWVCPLAPPENWLDIPIRAGERLAAG
jgi:uncharacterized protein (DUF1684 family)